MAAPVPVLSADKPKSPANRAAFFLLHTLAVYVCAIFFAPRLVWLWLSVIGPAMRITNGYAEPYDWFMQHICMMSILPALAIGYLNVRKNDSIATWSWIVPALVLGYRMLKYQPSGSVLIEKHGAAISYFFGSVDRIPTIASLFDGDPVRVLAQMSVTAPFYGGLAYSAGALLAKHKAVQRLFTFHSISDEPEC
jgi:hypothetical protein